MKIRVLFRWNSWVRSTPLARKLGSVRKFRLWQEMCFSFQNQPKFHTFQSIWWLIYQMSHEVCFGPSCEQIMRLNVNKTAPQMNVLSILRFRHQNYCKLYNNHTCNYGGGIGPPPLRRPSVPPSKRSSRPDPLPRISQKSNKSVQFLPPDVYFQV